jgi:hypothetical protein
MEQAEYFNLFIPDRTIYSSPQILQAVSYAHIVERGHVGPITSKCRILCGSITEVSNISNKLPPSLRTAVDLLSNKLLFREHTRSLFPDFYFKPISISELPNVILDFSGSK